MMDFKDTFVKNAYYKIKNNTLTEAAIFTAIELYLKRPLTEEQRARFGTYIQMIKDGKMSFDEYWDLYKSKISKYETSY